MCPLSASCRAIRPGMQWATLKCKTRLHLGPQMLPLIFAFFPARSLQDYCLGFSTCVKAHSFVRRENCLLCRLFALKGKWILDRFNLRQMRQRRKEVTRTNLIHTWTIFNVLSHAWHCSNWYLVLICQYIWTRGNDDSLCHSVHQDKRNRVSRNMLGWMRVLLRS